MKLTRCPKDCLRAKTCFRGQELPYDKQICYTPPKEKVLFAYDPVDYKHHYMNMAAYAYELERELKEHKRLIEKIGRLAISIRNMIEEGAKYVS